MQTFSKFVDPNTKSEQPLCYSSYFKDNVDLYRYKVPDLKRIARENGLFVSGTKPQLIVRIHANFNKIKLVVRCQANIRRNLCLNKINMRGPALKQKHRKRCVNDTDFFTLESLSEIDDKDFFSYVDDKGLIYGFDVKSLGMMYNAQGSLMNPYNRHVFEGKTLRHIITLIGKPNAKTEDEMELEMFNKLNVLRTKPISTRITDLFYEIDRLGNYTMPSWFSSLNRDQCIYLYKRIEELWNFRAELQNDAKQSICPFFNPFRYRLGRYSGYINTNRESQLTEGDCKKICVLVMENLIYTGVDDLSKNLITVHILSALTLVSNDAKTSMPWLYDSIMYLFSL